MNNVAFGNTSDDPRSQAGSRRVLIVSPHFPPTSAADMHRVRMVLPFLRDEGWEAEILTVAPDQVAAPKDDWLIEGLPGDVPIHTASGLGLAWTCVPGLGTLGWRSMRALSRKGRQLLAERKFDLVYFSTTVVEVHLLGPTWHRRFGVPFAVDFQDPWVNDYYRDHPHVTPPGGRLKYGVVDVIHRWMEPRVLKYCAGFTSVSAEYVVQLEQRYPKTPIPQNVVLPFPGAQRDLDRLHASAIPNPLFDSKDGNLHWVYTGVVIDGMLPVIAAFLCALRNALPEADLRRLRIHFIGTSYAPAGRSTPKVLPLAAQFGMTGQVREVCDRLPYVQALQCLADAHALLAFGSDDPGYTASKVYPYLLARKPMLAIFHEDSSVTSLLRKVGGAVSVPFRNPIDAEVLAARIEEAWVKGGRFSKLEPMRTDAFAPHTDRGCALALSRFFSACIRHDDPINRRTP